MDKKLFFIFITCFSTGTKYEKSENGSDRIFLLKVYLITIELSKKKILKKIHPLKN
jgi:hypothetical protein